MAEPLRIRTGLAPGCPGRFTGRRPRLCAGQCLRHRDCLPVSRKRFRLRSGGTGGIRTGHPVFPWPSESVLPAVRGHACGRRPVKGDSGFRERRSERAGLLYRQARCFRDTGYDRRCCRRRQGSRVNVTLHVIVYRPFYIRPYHHAIWLKRDVLRFDAAHREDCSPDFYPEHVEYRGKP